jgi:hypothetical protein
VSFSTAGLSFNALALSDHVQGAGGHESNESEIRMLLEDPAGASLVLALAQIRPLANMEFFRPYLTPGFLIGLVAITILTVLIKRRYFSPLSDIPGPFFASFTRLWQIVTLVQGDSVNVFYDLHQKYGPFVRVAPNEVSVNHPDAPKQLLLTALAKVLES